MTLLDFILGNKKEKQRLERERPFQYSIPSLNSFLRIRWSMKSFSNWIQHMYLGKPNLFPQLLNRY